MRNGVSDLIESVSSWEGISAEPHRFGGTQFNAGRVEIGHVHRGGQVDIPFTRRIRDQLLAEGRANPHHVLPESGWITFTMRADGDVERALWLLRLSMLHKRLSRARRSGEGLDALKRALDALDPSPELRERVGL